nr:hypothetical protein [Tanacetum cinerariifolium]
MESNKSIHRSDEQKNLYKALVDAYECDKLILDTYRDTVTLKRRRDDEDKDKEPFVGSNWGSKKRRAGKEPESTNAPKEKTSKTSVKSTKGSKSYHRTTSESAPAEEPMHITQDLKEPAPQEFKTGATDDQPIEEVSQHPHLFQKQTKPPTLDRAWHKTLSATYGRIQPWINNLAMKADSRTLFNELINTPVNFSAFVMNRIKVDTLTPELLADPTYELMKGSCDFKRLCIQAIEDMLLLLVQGKLTNLTIDERFAFNVTLRMITRSIVIQRRVEDHQLGL